MASLFKHSGYRLVIGDRRSIASPHKCTALPEMWKGWTKNMFLMAHQVFKDQGVSLGTSPDCPIVKGVTPGQLPPANLSGFYPRSEIPGTGHAG
jgi:hypothetical protein